MKKLLLCTAVILAAASCTTTPSYTINGTVADSTLNGSKIYLTEYSANKPIDSCVITAGKFTFKGNVDSLSILRVNGDRLYANILVENGVIDVNLGNPSTVGGTPLNIAMNEYSTKTTELNNDFSGRMKAVSADSTLNEMQQDSIYSKLRAEYAVANNAIQDPIFESNKTNALGLYIAWNKIYELSTTAQIDSLANIVGAIATNFKPFQEIRQAMVNQENTTEGKMFVDFAVVNLDGTPAKLSEYVGKGKYVLADFWASWCGPCKAEVPTIKEVYKAYNDKGLTVLGVNVWDSKEACEKAIAELEMPWSQICDFEGTTATDTYGINGIPCVILFAPDGTIAARGLRGNAMKEKIAEVMKK